MPGKTRVPSQGQEVETRVTVCGTLGASDPAWVRPRALQPSRCATCHPRPERPQSYPVRGALLRREHMLHAILAGERAPQRLASHRDRRCKHDQATIAKALEGHWRAEHLFALQQALEQYEFVQQQLRACETQIEACLLTFVTLSI